MSEKTYTFYWKTGEREVLEGRNPADALTQAGYGGGAVRALDFHAKGCDTNYEWNAERQKWERVAAEQQVDAAKGERR